MREIDCTSLMDSYALAKSAGSPSTITDYMIAAFARAMRLNGLVCAGVSLAVDTPGGVASVTVAVEPAQTPAEIAPTRAKAVDRARQGAFRPVDLTPPGPGMLSNLGTHGVDQFTGVLPIGQPLLLTLGAIRRRVIASGTGLAVAPTMYATVTADHRLFDGADAAHLLSHLTDELESIAATERTQWMTN
jgi:pyruvate dehydrogenase E2 component (dihydrolipoamide acetyltransferase)